MRNFSIVRIRQSLTFFFISCIIFATCAEAKPPAFVCDEQIARLNLGITAEHTICINADIVTNNTQSFKHVLAANAHDLSLSSSEIIDIFGREKFTLVIDGVCSGKCSRLLMPLANDIIFTDNSFAALTDNSINSRGYYITKLVGSKNKNKTVKASDLSKVSVNEIAKLKPDYLNKLSDEYLPDIEIIKLSAKSVTHLTWHSFVRQNLTRQINQECLPIDSLAVILTPEYFSLNYFRVKGRYALPSDNSIIEQLGQIMTDETIIIYSYEKEPFSGCAD